MFEVKFNLFEVMGIMFAAVMAVALVVIVIERQHRRETDELKREIAELRARVDSQRELIDHMQQRLWPGDPSNSGNRPNSSTSINISGGQGVFGSSAGRDINQANAGGK